ncbi:MAG: hypothetical protein RQM92_02425 [Candidatus Syntrophopropionicum ammoniitolerans]
MKIGAGVYRPRWPRRPPGFWIRAGPAHSWGSLAPEQDLAMRRQRHELHKAAERMRRAAELYKQPLQFTVKKDKLRIWARDRRSGAGREFTLEEAKAWLEELDENKGKNLIGYV